MAIVPGTVLQYSVRSRAGFYPESMANVPRHLVSFVDVVNRGVTN